MLSEDLPQGRLLNSPELSAVDNLGDEWLRGQTRGQTKKMEIVQQNISENRERKRPALGFPAFIQLSAGGC